MKLTNMMRDAYVRGVMADVPEVNYQEQAIKLLLNDAVARLPPKVKEIWANGELRQFLRMKQQYFQFVYLEVPCANNTEYSPSPEASKQLSELVKLHNSQNKTRDELRSKLYAIARSCSTRKQLAEALPEFEKYLPEEESVACRSLPVVTHVLDEFVAAGWPKKRTA